jgi:hypothetical protein
LSTFTESTTCIRRPFLGGLDESADDGNDSQRATYSSMMPLPRLKILRETYCSQQVVDTALDSVEVHRPELIEKLMEEEHWRQQAYSERAWDIIEYLTEEKVEIPTSLIGRMDLINEFTRRGRSAYGRPEIPPKGKPPVSGPDQPLPPLVKLDINERTRKHIMQEVADSVLQTAYERRPDLWLAFSEEHRHEVLLDATVQFRVLLRGSGRATSG